MPHHELTIAQAREIARLRRHHPGAEVRTHERPWGVIVEVRRRGHVVEIERFDFDGETRGEQRIGLAA